MTRVGAVLITLLLACAARAEVEVRRFDSEAERARYRALIEELRCPQCQNQNLAASDAPIARDLRAEVLRLLREGRSDPEILEHLVERYGDFVRYRPAWQPSTYLLWIAPGLLLAIAGALVAGVVRRQRRAAGSELNPGQQAALERLLRAAERDDR
jgi:cytochrome c-type biogenesis protein CcmH